LNILKPELDSETLGAVEPGERFAINHCVVAK
jgi:hypothetical protein